MRLSSTIPTSFAEVSPPLASVLPVVAASRHVRTDPASIEAVADWLAYEEFTPPPPHTSAPMGRDRSIGTSMLISALNFAFTDFETGERFTVEGPAGILSDSEAMYHCIERAIHDGVPLLDGSFLAGIGLEDLEQVLHGGIRMPMLEERVEVLRAVGTVLERDHGGSFARFIDSCAPRLYADGDGVLERLVTEFPRFDDASMWQGRRVEFHKLAQLSLWSLHAARLIALEDLERMTAFADYIVPVALRVLGILSYSDDLEARIREGVLIARDSDEEIEIRAHTIHATALLTEAVNRRRPEHLALVIPQLDYRLWKAYHATFLPHHLTRTIMY